MFSRFEHLKITGFMGYHKSENIVFTDPLRFDCILSAALAMDILKDDFFLHRKQAGTWEQITGTLGEFLYFDGRIFHASCGFGEGVEYNTFYKKGYDSFNDDLIKFSGKGKQVIDTTRGRYKNYMKTLHCYSWPYITFYATGDAARIYELLTNYIKHVGKKAGAGFGRVHKWDVEAVDYDYSLFKDGVATRPIPAVDYDVDEEKHYLVEASLIPPAWRDDYHEVCWMAVRD